MPSGNSAKLQRDFELLHDELRRCSLTYPPLFHERFTAWNVDDRVRLSDDQWQRFTGQYSAPPDDALSKWWCWNGPWPITNDEDVMGRFFGSSDGFSEFLTLANACGTLLLEADPDQIEGSGGYDTWLYHLHHTALLYPSMLLEVEESIWDQALDDTRRFEDIVGDWDESEDIRIPKHPVVHSLKHPVFTSSMTLIRALLDRDSVRTWEDPIDELPQISIKYQEEIPMISAEAPPSENIDNEWVLRGGAYEVRFGSGRNQGIVLVDSKHVGCKHIVRLIENEGRGVHVMQFDIGQKKSARRNPASTITQDELFGSVSTDENESVFDTLSGSSEADCSDDPALQSMRERIGNINREMVELRKTDQSVSKLAKEKERIEKQMKTDFDNFGRPRKLGISQREKARKAVSDALSKQYERLRDKLRCDLPDLANHLEDSIRWDGKTGSFAYHPARPMTWKTQTGTYTARRP